MKDYKNLVELIIDEDSDGVFAISFVENPAIGSNFIALSNSEIKLRVTNNEKRIVTGSILIPEKAILRADDDGNPYHIFFSKDTVEKLSQKYLNDHNQGNVTLEHQIDVPDIMLVESWIKIDDLNDKSVVLGLDAPLGTWVGSFKVNNLTVWENIVKTGMVKGFSVEAMMKKRELIKNSTNMKQVEEMDNKTLFEKLVELFSRKEEEVVEAAEPEMVEEVKEPEATPDYVTKADLQVIVDAMYEKFSPTVETVEAKEVVVEEEVEEEVEMVSLADNKKNSGSAFEWKGKLSLNDRIKHNLNLN